MTNIQFDIILYHGNCPDGFTSAWAFWITFGNKASYIPQKYNESNLPDVTNKNVAVVDFSYSREITLSLASKANYLVVLDHHRSSQRELANLELCDKGQIIFDMKRSGAQLAWDYLYKSNRPWFIDYVADRDLWTHSLPNTKEISQALFFEDYFKDFTKLDSLYYSKDKIRDIDYFTEKGSIMIAFKDKDVLNCSLHAIPVKMYHKNKKYNVRLVCCPRQYRSDVGNKICEIFDCDFAAMYFFDYNNNQWWISMRASKESNIDLALIASELPGGGGHSKAAGFVIEGSNGENLYTYFKRQ